MKTLFLLRHAKSSHAIADLADLLRPLNERGYDDARTVATWLKKLTQKPEQIITSPAIRAYTTATIFAQYLNIPNDAMHIQPNLYFTGKAQIFKVIKALNNKCNSIMLVGHNPDFEAVLQAFTKSKTSSMPTTSVAILNFDIKKWDDVNHSNCKLSQLISPVTINAKKQEASSSKHSITK